MLRLFLFGAPHIELDGRVIPLRRSKALALLAYLAMAPQPQEREVLLALLWPEFDTADARNNLRRELSLLKAALNADLLVADRSQVARNAQVALWLDVAVFQEQIALRRQHGHPPGEACALCVNALTTATRLYTDDFMAGFSLPDSPAFDEWQFYQREALRQHLVEALQTLVAWHEQREEYSVAVQLALRQLVLDPLYEPAQRELMRLYTWAGQPAAALRQYEQCVRVLQEELGVGPEAATTDLFEAIRSKRFPTHGAPSAVRDSSSSGVQPLRLAASLRPQTRYVASGEVHIAYQVIGEGPLDIMIVGGFVSHLEQMWEEPGVVQFLQRLSATRRIILFDKRGVGLSDRVGYSPTLEDTMDDLLAVMHAAGARRPVLFGVSEGGPNGILFAATYPERLASLILYGTAARFTRTPDYPWALTGEQFDRWLDRLIAGWGGPVSLEYFAPTRAGDRHFQEWWARMLRLGSSPGSVKAVLEIERDIDVRPILPAIQVPTLILHRTGDRVTRVEGARYLAQCIPGATFVELAGNDHWWWVGETDSLLGKITTFLDQISQPQPSSLLPSTERILTTLMLAELSAAQEVDDGIERVLPEHVRALVQREVMRYRGREVRWSSNQVLAAFDGPSRAIHCVVAVRAAAKEQNVTLRAGLHTGECVFSNSEISGIAVQITIGVMSSAAPGEVLVSSTVKDLVLGSGFDFQARGSHILTGTVGDWQLFALRNDQPATP